MRKVFLILVFSLLFEVSTAQVDSLSIPDIPNKEYAVYRYDSTLLLDILIYQYSDLWDIDNDGQNDSIKFISNGGAHAFYNMKIWLSSSGKWREYPTFYIDFPYPSEVDSLEELNDPYPQLVVQDFDNDNTVEIYLNLNNPFASIPKQLVGQGVTSKQILIDYRNNELKVLNFKK